MLREFLTVYEKILKSRNEGDFNYEFRRFFLFSNQPVCFCPSEISQTEKRDKIAGIIDNQLQNEETQRFLEFFNITLERAQSLFVKLSQEVPILKKILEEEKLVDIRPPSSTLVFRAIPESVEIVDYGVCNINHYESTASQFTYLLLGTGNAILVIVDLEF